MNGLYLHWPGGNATPASAEARGPLAGEATNDQITVYFEGLLLSDRQAGKPDPEVALDAFLRGGPDELARLDGFFNALVIDQGIAHLVSDMFASRPLLIYRSACAIAIAPTPLFFRDLGLPMSLDRQGLFESIRVYHGLQGRTLISEIERPRPRTRYTIEASGRLTKVGPTPVEKREDSSITLDAAADLMRQQQREVIGQLLAHPALQGRERDLPLTAGMDSRQLLAELLELGAGPDRVVHIWHQDAEATPVMNIASELSLPLVCTRVHDLDWPALTRHWLQTTAGLLHYHQAFLFGVADPSRRTVGFDGYLADYFTGYAPRPLAKRNYNPLALRMIFSDRVELETSFQEAVAAELSLWRGPESWAHLGLDPMNRGPGYTGWVFGAMPGDNLYFAPAAHPKALEIYCTVPAKYLCDKAARLHMFRRDFPQLAKFPTEQGTPLSDAKQLPVSSKMNRAKWSQLARGFSPWSQADPAPQTEHAWLRQIGFLRRLADRVFAQGEFFRDAELGPLTHHIWRMHRTGAYSAWTVMGLISAEVAHQVLIKRRDPLGVANWLLE